jgi:POT family proton-dependent oligopeptide transporter
MIDVRLQPTFFLIEESRLALRRPNRSRAASSSVPLSVSSFSPVQILPSRPCAHRKYQLQRPTPVNYTISTLSRDWPSRGNRLNCARMSKTPYRSTPTETTGMPAGIPYIVGNEAAERFTFYGLKAVLVIFMTQHLLNAAGQKAPMGHEEAKQWFHTFVAAVYYFPLLGALISDGLLGKYRTILTLSIVYTLGSVVLAANQTQMGLFAGLALIALGSGGIKPCVSAHVGDQFGKSNAHLLAKAFGWFYFSVNFGSSFSTWFVPVWLEKYGAKLAFGVPAFLMALATIIFWSGRRKFIHIPPGGMGFVSETFGFTGIKSIAGLFSIYIFVAIFWSLWDQSSSAWVLQAEKMDLNLFGYQLQAAQVQTANPILILLFIPLFTYVIYPALDKIFPLTPLRKISIGLWVTAASFTVSALIEANITAGGKPSVWWQILAFVILSAAEIMVSITCLEFSYTQAPKKMKSLIMAIYYASIALGNTFTALVNKFIQNPDHTSKLAGASYYWFFTGVMAVAAFIFIFVAIGYKGKTYVQDAPEGA